MYEREGAEMAKLDGFTDRVIGRGGGGTQDLPSVATFSIGFPDLFDM